MTTTTHASHPTAVRSTTLQQGARPQLQLVRVAGSGPAGAPRRVVVAEAPLRLTRRGGGVLRPVVVAEAPLRLTRRGRGVLRALVVLGLVGLLAATALLMAHRADAADGPAPAVVVQHHVVLPGETLWGIASGLAPGADPRDTIASIVEFNALQSSAVHAGQDLAIPPQLSNHR